jgi:hypothetical protein
MRTVMSDYQRAMLHVELALRRVSDKLRAGGETNIEDALWAVAEEIGSLSEETHRANDVNFSSG